MEEILTITWKQALEIHPYLVARGLRIVGSNVSDAPDTTPELLSGNVYAGTIPELVVTAPPALLEEMRLVNQQSTLSKMLSEMLNAAKSTPNEPQRRSLKNGLTIAMIIDLGGDLRLQISRPDVYPSDLEWDTVLAHFPIELPKAPPQNRFTTKNGKFLRSGWKMGGKK